MDFGYLLQILARRKWLILMAMLLAAAAVFYLIGRKPEGYKATVILSTDIVNYKGLDSSGDDAFVQQFQIENAFANLIDLATSRTTLKILTLHLLEHDLSGSEQPFRQPNYKIFGEEAIQRDVASLLHELKRIKLDSITDPSFSQQFDLLTDRVARTYGYDHDALLRSIAVKRKGTTDYLTVEVHTENPVLSQYLANSYVNLFITYYENRLVREKRKNVQFYTQLAREKKSVVDTIKARRYAYLFRKGLPALGKQSEELVTQIADLELQKQAAEAGLLAAKETMGTIQQYIDGRGKADVGETRSRVIDKYNVADLNAQVRQLTERSAQTGGKDARIEAELAGARHALDLALQSSAGNLGKSTKTNEEMRRTKEDLFKSKVQADVQRIESEKTLGIINNEIGKLTNQLSVYVSNDEIATGLADDQERAEEEFKTVNEELIKAKLALANTENPLHIIENAQLPEWPEPNRQVLISVFAAIVVGTMVVIGLFLLAYLDGSLQSPEMFGRYTDQLPLLGYTPFIAVKDLDLQAIFSSNGELPRYTHFRENLRKMRNRLLADDARTILFTSTQGQQGKTLTAYSLAHALAANQKRVVILDTNFKTPLPAALSLPDPATETALKKVIRLHQLEDLFRPGTVSVTQQGIVAIVAHHGAHLSPAELMSPDQFRAFLKDLLLQFDFVFMEAAAINDYADAQELVPFADRVIAVFNARSVLKTKDKNALAFLRNLKERFAGAVLAGVDEKNL